jgi:hypothetical protein
MCCDAYSALKYSLSNVFAIREHASDVTNVVTRKHCTTLMKRGTERE